MDFKKAARGNRGAHLQPGQLPSGGRIGNTYSERQQLRNKAKTPQNTGRELSVYEKFKQKLGFSGKNEGFRNGRAAFVSGNRQHPIHETYQGRVIPNELSDTRRVAYLDQIIAPKKKA